MSLIVDLENKLKECNRIAVFGHVVPDADAIASCLAFKHIIHIQHPDTIVDVFLPGEVGDLYKPMLLGVEYNPNPLTKYDMAIVLDCPSTSRTDRFEPILKSAGFIANIDHHETNEKFGDWNFVAKKVSSSGELVYFIARMMNCPIDNKTASLLYQAIMTDSNCFTAPSVTKNTHKIVSELLKHNFDANELKRWYFKNDSRAKVYLATCAQRSIKFYYNDALSVMKITSSDYEKSEATHDDTLGIVDKGLEMSDVEVSAILIEKEPGKIYCSLRSKGKVNITEIAQHFGGGGNKSMAAFQHDGDLKEFTEEFVSYIKPYMPQATNQMEDHCEYYI